MREPEGRAQQSRLLCLGVKKEGIWEPWGLGPRSGGRWVDGECVTRHFNGISSRQATVQSTELQESRCR